MFLHLCGLVHEGILLQAAYWSGILNDFCQVTGILW